MSKSNRLRLLKMGVTWKDDIYCSLGQLIQGLLTGSNQRNDFINGLSQV